MRKPSPFISVIVPCYNCEEYIERCIDSLFNQSFADIEIIAVNDGSTDQTLPKLKLLQDRDSRLIIIDKTNAGVSSARNAGLSVARGKYVIFCDSDDFVKEEYLSSFFKYEVSQPALLMQTPVQYNEVTNKVMDKFIHLREGIFNISDGIVVSKLLHNGYAVGKLFLSKIIRTYDIRFDTTIQYKEDLIFTLQYLKYVNLIILIEVTQYYYCIHPGSLSNKWKNPIETININTIIVDLVEKFKIPAEYIKEFETFCVGEVIHAIYNNNFRHKVKTLRLLRESLHTDAYLFQTKADKILHLLFWKRMFFLYNLFKKITDYILRNYYQ